MPEVTLPLRQWLPDQPDHNNPGLVEARNAVFRSGGWQPIRSHGSPSGGTLSWATTASLHSFTTGTLGVGYLYVHDNVATHINSSSVVQSTFTFGTGPTNIMTDFARFDDDVYMSSSGRDLFKFNIPTSTFSAVGGPITSRASIARVGNFLVMGGDSDGSGADESSIAWSGFNQPEAWATSDLTLAGSAEMEFSGLGPVIAIEGGDYGLIFQSGGITRLDYVGPPKIWGQRPLSQTVGVIDHRSVVTVGSLRYFVARSGVYVTNGTEVNNISDGVLSDWLNLRFETSSVTTIQGSYFPEMRSIIWGLGNFTGNQFFDSLVYSLETGGFSIITDSYYGADMGQSPNRDIFTRGISKSGSNSSKLTAFDGDTYEATLTTGHLAMAGEMTFVDGIEPIYEGAGATVALSRKERIRDAASFSAYQAEEAASGVVEITSDARSTATSVKFAAGEAWSDFSGVVANIERSSKR